MPQSKFDLGLQVEGSFNQTELKVKGASANALTLKPNETLSAARILNLIVNNADRAINLGGDLTLANAFSTSGAFALTLTATAATNVTLPTTGTLATLNGAETFTNKTLTNPLIESAARTTSTSFSVFNATATTIFAFGAATTGNVGYSGTDTSTTNISTGATASTKTKTLNLGTGGAAGSTTNVNIGSSIAGSTTINSSTLLGASTTQNVFNTVATTVNAFGAASILNLGAGGLTTIAGGLFTSGTPTIPSTTGLAGTWLGWNQSGGLGESVLANFRQLGSGGFDFKIYSNAATLVATPLQIKESSVDINVTSLRFNNSTSAFAYFGVGGAGVPTFTTRSVGTKSVYYDTLSSTSVDYARGISASTLWDSIPEATSGFSYKLFAGTTQILQIKGNGDMSLVGDFNARNISLETTNPSIKFKESGFTDTAGIFFRTSGTGDNNFLGLTGSASDANPISQTLGFKVTQSGRCIAIQPTAGFGYGIEANSSVTQLTSKTTAVSINTLSGQITMNNASLAQGATAIFRVDNTLLEDKDVVHAFSKGASTGIYRVAALAGVNATSFLISVSNIGTTASEAVVINYIIIRGGSAAAV